MNWFALAIDLKPLVLVVFLALFGAIALWAYAPRRRGYLEDCGRIPLRDDEN